MTESKSSIKSCSVCVEELTRNGAHSAIACPSCGYDACSECVTRYHVSTDGIGLEPKCMSCGQVWDTRFLWRNVGTSGQRARIERHLAKMRVDMHINNAVSLAMPLAEVEREYRTKMECIKHRLESLKQEKEVIEERLWDDEAKAKAVAASMISWNSKEADMERITAEEKYCRRVMRRLSAWKDMQFHSIRSGNKRHQYIRRCGVNGCQGLLDKDWHCGACGSVICEHCIECKNADGNEEHQCSKSNVETATLMSTDCRPCPSCKIPTYKLEGCDQMWCVQCHVAYSWDTGLILSTAAGFHNPHLHEWQVQTRRTGDTEAGRALSPRRHGAAIRTIGDVPCGGITSETLEAALDRCGENLRMLEVVDHLYETTSIIRDEMMVALIEKMQQMVPEKDTIAYILGDIDLPKLSAKVTRVAKDAEWSKELYWIYDTYCVISEEKFRAFARGELSIKDAMNSTALAADIANEAIDLAKKELRVRVQAESLYLCTCTWTCTT